MFKRIMKRIGWERTSVYRFYGKDGVLLYVGITNSPKHRFAQHGGKAGNPPKPWWKYVDHKRTRITWYNSRAKALRVEEEMIKQKGPVYNKIHNEGWRNKKYQPKHRKIRTQLIAASLLGAATLYGEHIGQLQLATDTTIWVWIATLGTLGVALKTGSA